MLFGLSTKALSAIGAGTALLVVAVTSAVVMANDDDFGSVEAPRWQAGHAFAYDITGDLEYLFEIPGEGADSDRFEFGPFPVEKEILSTQFDIDGKPLYVGAATFPLGQLLADGLQFDFPDLAVYPTADRQADLAPVGVRIDDSGDALEFGPDSPVTYLDFPLKLGKRWDDTLYVGDLFGDADFLEGTDLVGLDEVLVQAEVGSLERLSLPIGTVDAVRVDITYTPVGLQKAVAQARSDAEKFGFDVDRLNVQLGIHEIAHYSPAYQSIVRDEFVLRMLFDAAVDFDGDHYEVYTEATARALAEMTGANLLKGPDRSMDEILRILRGQAPIADAHGQSIDDSAVYDLFVTADRQRVNAAEAEVVHFTTDLSGVPALPDGHALEYAVVDPTGRIAHQGGVADDFSVVFDEPGSYSVVVQAVDGSGRPVARDMVQVVADYHTTQDADCSTVTTYYVMSCDEADLPVRHGIQSLVVEVPRNGTGLLDFGELTVYGPDGERYDGERGPDGALRVQVDDFDARSLGGDWYAEYSTAAGVTEDVTYVIDLVYGSVAYEPPSVTDSPEGMLAMRDARVLGSFGGPLGDLLGDLSHGEEPRLLDAGLSLGLF